jgi:release factor glutamine methyltransferase
MNYKELYEFGCLQLKAADISDYKVDARLLLEYVTGEAWSKIFLKDKDTIEPEKEETYKALLKKRASHIPLQHLTNTQNFMGFDFYVNEDVLIPRFDTEVLVEEALKELHDGMRILDMCTGSGCILLSLLKLSNDTTGVGADISDRALRVFNENVKRLKLSERVTAVQSDLFENVQGDFDVLVSNPPYIRTCEIEELMPEVRDHDPFIALNGHESGLYFYERIVEECDSFLHRGSLVFFEIGNDQGAEVSALLKNKGYLDVTVIKDFGNNTRVVKAIHS